jgi:protein dithiol oxidoreductase (disulfide-forming)
MRNFFGYLLLMIGACILLPTTLYAANEPYKNEIDYLTLPASATTQIPTTKNKITVVEFFSFGCPACYKLEPAMQQWIKHKPSYVEFYRVPVIFQPAWKVYAQSYYIMKSLNEEHRLFPLLFAATQKDHQDLSTSDMMANFFASHGISKDKFHALYNTPSIDLDISNGQKLMNTAMIYQVPTVLIDGTYRVDPSLTGADINRFTAVVNYLVIKQAMEKKLITPKVVVVQMDDQTHTAKSD